MKVSKYIIVSLIIAIIVAVLLPLSNSRVAVKGNDTDECIAVIEKMANAVNSNDFISYMNCFVENERRDMKDFLSYYPSELFREKEYKLVNIKELPKEIIPAIGASVSRNGDLDGERFFYCGIKMRVDKEEKWLYNGTNYRVIIMKKENGSWKIEGIVVPSYRVIVEKGFGFGTVEESASEKIEQEMEQKGLVKNYRGDIIEDLRPTDADLKKEKGLQFHNYGF